MENRKLQVTAQDLDRLVTDVQSTPAQPVGDHLTDNELIDYIMEELSVEQEARIDLHLASCKECIEEMGRVADGVQTWEGSAGEQRLAALRERIHLSLKPTLTSLKDEIDSAAGQVSASIKRLANSYQRWLQPRSLLLAAPQGEKIIVVNTIEEILLRFVSEPQVDSDGYVTLAITLDEAALAVLPEQFFLDLLFLLTDKVEVLQTVQVTSKERLRLRTVRGLEVKAKLPAIEPFLVQLRHMLNTKDHTRRPFPRSAFSLRIWW